jgi:hypothetical protein
MSDFLSAIDQIYGQDLFIYADPQIADFTRNQAINLVIFAKGLEIKIPFSNTDSSMREMLGLLKVYLGNENSILLTWNIKDLLTYIRAKTGLDFSLNGNVLDLAIIERYFGITLARPQNFSEAFQRIKKLMINPNWNSVYKIYGEVYRPLIDILPKIESLGLVRIKEKSEKVFCHYEIDGQINGRFKCCNTYSRSFNPHSLSSSEKEVLFPIGFDNYFVFLDIKHMEVSMLQWLSKDRYLADIIESGKDAYCEIWKSLTGTECKTPEHRKIAKECFLPVVFGLGANTLSQDLKISLDTAKRLVDKIYKIIPDSMDWVKAQQESIKDNRVKDYFGRTRDCDTPYKARNFSVQSPSALVCTHKLVKLAKSIETLASVSMYIHDGYVLVCNKKNLKETIQRGCAVIESDDPMYPGLKFSVVCEVGKNLGDLKLFER